MRRTITENNTKPPIIGAAFGERCEMKAIWAKNIKTSMNTTLAFSLDFGQKERFEMKIVGASLYRIYADGKFLRFGPQRAAKGYARESALTGNARYLVVEVENIFAESFWVVKQEPFFACEIQTQSGKTYDATDFTCRLLTDRIQRVQRYSYQRGFIESYKMQKDRRTLYVGGGVDFPVLETEETALPIVCPSYVDEPKYTLHKNPVLVEKGCVTVDAALPVWRDRAHTLVGTALEGYKIEEWEDAPTDETSLFVYHVEEHADKKYVYRTVDFSQAITGFTQLEIMAKNAGTVYVLYDELLWEESGKGKNHVGFERNATSNVFKWRIEKSGEYHVSTFEPYTYRYAKIICTEGIDVQIAVCDFENPNTDRLQFACADKRAEKIIEAARTTLAQNAVDLLTDCPSRERAGWLSDSWFSSVAERIFTGENQSERAFLENYQRAHRQGLPENMLPMCYPSDVLECAYIPNWALWYIMEISKYANVYGKDKIVVAAKENVLRTLRFFEKYENEIGLLENLEGWVFVEWSEANAPSHICGVNIPSNIAYAACLFEAGTLYGNPLFIQKATHIRQKIKELAFDGTFFVDNLVRDKNGRLKQSGLLTEVCQYYAFWFDCISVSDYPVLYDTLINRLGTNRADGYLPEMGKPNVMYGLYMRMDLLMRQGKRKEIYQECIQLFEKMAERTGTLWEHNGIAASCVHGFAAYAVKWLVYALTGYDCMTGKTEATDGIGIDCDIVLPKDAAKQENIKISVRNNRVFCKIK